jgi:signal transduction histidine kinase
MLYQECSKEALLRDACDMRQQIVTLQALAKKHADTESVLQERTRLLSLSAAVGTALAGNDSLRTILQRCAEALVQHLGVAAACIWSLDAEEKVLEMEASAGKYMPVGDLYGSIRLGESAIGILAQKRQPYVTDRVFDDVYLTDEAWVQGREITAFAGYPLVVEDRLVGVVAMFSEQPFSNATLKALAWVAGVMAMGIDRICVSDALARSIAKVVRMNKSLQRKNTELDEFTYVASHDLQEPLRKLITFSSMLRTDLGSELSELAEKDLAFIVDAAVRMQTLIHSLLDLARTGRTIMRHDEVALDVCVDHALADLSRHLNATEATIVRDALPSVCGDQTMLTKVYQNLLSNALKFCGEHRPIIHLTVEQRGDQLVLGVQDNGIGIKPEYHEQIFAPFKRLHGHGVYEGTGIGLAICYKIVERHGGHMWVESDAHQGAHFKFTLANRTQVP